MPRDHKIIAETLRLLELTFRLNKDAGDQLLHKQHEAPRFIRFADAITTMVDASEAIE